MRYRTKKLLNGANSDFTRSVMTLVSGTVLAQLLSYSVSPLISRLYTPEDMAYLSLFSKVISFLAVFGTLRYEHAFPLPKRDEHAFSIFSFSSKLTLLISLFSLICVTFLCFYEGFYFKNNFFLFSIPIGILLVSFFHQNLNWAIRMKKFKAISYSKVAQTSVNSIITLSLGFLNFGYKGLLFGYLSGVFSANIFFIKTISTFPRKMEKFKFKGREKVMLRKYKDLPKYNLPHVLLDLSRDLFVAFYILVVFEKEVLGLYEFSYRMLRVPIALIGVSIGQVFVKKAADLLNENKSIYNLTKRTVWTLLIISIAPFSILLFYGNPIFSFVFGSNWKGSGEYSQIMSIWLMVNFIISPLSQIPILLEKQEQFLIYSFIGHLLFILCLVSDKLFLFLTFKEVLVIVSVVQTVYLLFLLCWILKISSKKNMNEFA